MKIDGEKGIAVVQWRPREIPTGHRTREWVETKLASITKRAKSDKECRFNTLAYLLNEDFLKSCFEELKRFKAPGIDGVSVSEYEKNIDENLRDLYTRMKAKRYRPQPVKRVYIPKSSGDKRPLGIPAVEDKIVQLGIKKILEPICEADFLDCSFGFRPQKNCHQALDEIYITIRDEPINHVVDMDIKKFFDTVDHKLLMECVKQRVKDPNMISLIGRFLKSGLIEEGKYMKTEQGTPQGGVLSPLLANLYLHFVLDLWFEKVAKKEFTGLAKLIRYADDFVVCFQRKTDAEKFSQLLKQRLEKFGLEIAEDKSRVVAFGRFAEQNAKGQGKRPETFNFLGITHYCFKSRKGNFLVGRKTDSKKFRQKIKEMNEWLKKVRNATKLKNWWETLGIKLHGHYRYFGISGNYDAINKFGRLVEKYAFKWINRRSQRKSYTWEQFSKFKQYNPIAKPKIYHSYPAFV